jgi:hypothetical protein
VYRGIVFIGAAISQDSVGVLKFCCLEMCAPRNVGSARTTSLWTLSALCDQVSQREVQYVQQEQKEAVFPLAVDAGMHQNLVFSSLFSP